MVDESMVLMFRWIWGVFWVGFLYFILLRPTIREWRQIRQQRKERAEIEKRLELHDLAHRLPPKQKIQKRKSLRRTARKGPNSPCPCGSGKKTKKCGCDVMHQIAVVGRTNQLEAKKEEAFNLLELRDKMGEAVGMTGDEIADASSEIQGRAFRKMMDENPDCFTPEQLEQFFGGATYKPEDAA